MRLLYRIEYIFQVFEYTAALFCLVVADTLEGAAAAEVAVGGLWAGVLAAARAIGDIRCVIA